VSDKRDELRAPILEVIAIIRRDYEKALEPYIKRLCEIDAIYMPAMRISVDDAARMQIEVVELRDPQS
jgi:hypothetical protein